MAYIGRGTDKLSNIEKLDTITFDGSSSYTLQKNSVNFTPSSANNLQVSIDGVVQAGNFTVSGSTIDFGVAIPATSTCDFIFHYGTGLITTPADGTVGLAQLSATGTKDSTTFLRGDNSFAEVPAGGITEADMWRLNTFLNMATSSATDITANLERVDTDGFGLIGTGMTESSGIFSFPSTGYWLIMVQGMVYGSGNNTTAAYLETRTTTDNSTYPSAARILNEIQGGSGYATGFSQFIFDVTNISTHKVKFTQQVGTTGVQLVGHTDKNSTSFSFIRLGDT